MRRGIPVEELNEETARRLGINVPPSFGDVGSNLAEVLYCIQVLGKVFKAIKDLNDEEALRVLQQVQMYIISRKNAPDIEIMRLPPDSVPESYAPPIDWTLQVVANLYCLKPEKLKQRNRQGPVAEARQVAMYVLYKSNQYSLAHIGQEIGGRSAATVSHAFTRIGNRVTEDPDLKEVVLTIQSLI